MTFSAGDFSCTRVVHLLSKHLGITLLLILNAPALDHNGVRKFLGIS